MVAADALDSTQGVEEGRQGTTIIILESGGGTTEFVTYLLGVRELALLFFKGLQFARLDFSFFELVVLEL